MADSHWLANTPAGADPDGTSDEREEAGTQPQLRAAYGVQAPARADQQLPQSEYCSPPAGPSVAPLPPVATPLAPHVALAGARGAYSYVSKSGGGGGSQTSIQINGSIGDALAGLLLPQAVQNLPLVGPALTSAVSWVPQIACLSCCYFCCCS